MLFKFWPLGTTRSVDFYWNLHQVLFTHGHPKDVYFLDLFYEAHHQFIACEIQTIYNWLSCNILTFCLQSLLLSQTDQSPTFTGATSLCVQLIVESQDRKEVFGSENTHSPFYSNRDASIFVVCQKDTAGE